MLLDGQCTLQYSDAVMEQCIASLGRGVFRLRDLDETLHWIGHLKYLQHLDLFGNSITEESKYRLRVLWQFPKLEILDQHGGFHAPLVGGSTMTPHTVLSINAWQFLFRRSWNCLSSPTSVSYLLPGLFISQPSRGPSI